MTTPVRSGTRDEADAIVGVIISLYLRHGFENVGQIHIGTSPVLTPMYRRAR